MADVQNCFRDVRLMRSHRDRRRHALRSPCALAARGRCRLALASCRPSLGTSRRNGRRRVCVCADDRLGIDPDSSELGSPHQSEDIVAEQSPFQIITANDVRSSPRTRRQPPARRHRPAASSIQAPHAPAGDSTDIRSSLADVEARLADRALLSKRNSSHSSATTFPPTTS